MAKSKRASRKSLSRSKRPSASKKSKSPKKKTSARKTGRTSTQSGTLKDSLKSKKRAARPRAKRLSGRSKSIDAPTIKRGVPAAGTSAKRGSAAAPQFNLPSGFRKDRVGKLLSYAISKLTEDGGDIKSLAAHLGAEAVDGRPEDALIPVILKLATRPPNANESYDHYKERIEEHLSPVRNKIKHLMGFDATPLITANSLKFKGSIQQIEELTKENKIERIELDPLLQLVNMDDSIKDIGAPAFRTRLPLRDGRGVNVAVLDSGIDLHHPYLSVSASVSTCGESIDIPGSHGTHCAGSIASRDSFYPGVAPGVSLLNIKVLTSDGRGTHTNVTQGMDRALEMGADILSMSLGFNHLPHWSDGGHGWQCDSGHCPLCTAVDNVSRLDNILVVVAAGNEHTRAEYLRQYGYAFDTELGCPGQAREAITVGATYKSSSQFAPAEFTSHGPTSYNTKKPNLVAPGVNITSTIPVPRDSNGNPVINPQRIDLFARKSGTSMATPIVAGVVALIVQRFKENGIEITNAAVKRELYRKAIMAIPGGDANIVGLGRVDISGLE